MKQQLLAAARNLFAQHGYAGVSIRAVADAAAVNPAMIHYYFDNKAGLYAAMLADSFTPLMHRISSIVGSADEPAALKDFLSVYMRSLGSNPWMPPLILREVVAEGGHLRGWFIQQFAAPGGGLLTLLVQREQSAGRIRADADPTLTALSLLSLAVFPFVAMPVTRELTGLRIKEGYLDRLVAHTERLFLEGLKP